VSSTFTLPARPATLVAFVLRYGSAFEAELFGWRLGRCKADRGGRRCPCVIGRFLLGM